MIGYISGIILQKQAPELLVDVNDIGYEIIASMNTFYQLAEVGKPVKLLTHLVVREDAHQLYGFLNEQERSMFRLLIKVNGVGPKMAITLLSSITPIDFVQCITNNDIGRLVRLPGIGKKTAERLIIEMRDRLKGWRLGFTTEELQNSASIISSAEEDAVSALISLGYKSQEAKNAVQHVAGKAESSEEIIRLALKALVK
jgi:Holliday junction DNA helicase RuvA